MSVRFSIIIVSLNPGEELRKTLNSIKEQSYSNYEIIIKDGGSTDKSLECLSDFSNLPIKLQNTRDTGIYHGMNQAVLMAQGDYVYFLNCGDYFSSKDVLKAVSEIIDETDAVIMKACPVSDKRNATEDEKASLIADKINVTEDEKAGHKSNSDSLNTASEQINSRYIFYGNIYERITKNVVSSNPKMDGFGCYRNVPCHQACFYDRSLVQEHPFDTEYKVRADYEQFLWCFYRAKAKTQYMNVLIADYEGGGYSEKNLKISKEEHRKITSVYMSKAELLRYRMVLILTLAPLRTAISRNPKTAKVYNAIKRSIYKVRK